ncbi:MAG: hypothetical protein NZ730_06615 [Porticoccaceae bacterium]|nr:hypothetical protein [Porticoccaceae bacterium]
MRHTEYARYLELVEQRKQDKRDSIKNWLMIGGFLLLYVLVGTIEFQDCLYSKVC